MIGAVFSNTTPIIALSGIKQLRLLRDVYQTVHVVDAVVEECATGGRVVVPDLTGLPWIKIEKQTKYPTELHHAVRGLDKGEKHTILAALRMRARQVIIDEKTGRNIAEYMGLSVIGTLGILLKARQMGKIDSFTTCVNEMRSNGIYYNTALVKKLALEIGE